MNQRQRESFNAGAHAHAQGEARPTQVCCLFDLRAYRAGWDDAHERSLNAPAEWDDVAVTLPVKAASVTPWTIVPLFGFRSGKVSGYSVDRIHSPYTDRARTETLGGIYRSREAAQAAINAVETA